MDNVKDGRVSIVSMFLFVGRENEGVLITSEKNGKGAKCGSWLKKEVNYTALCSTIVDGNKRINGAIISTTIYIPRFKTIPTIVTHWCIHLRVKR